MLILCLLQHHSDDDLGVALSDRFTLEVLNYMESINKTSDATMADLVRIFCLVLMKVEFGSSLVSSTV